MVKVKKWTTRKWFPIGLIIGDGMIEKMFDFGHGHSTIIGNPNIGHYHKSLSEVGPPYMGSHGYIIEVGYIA